MIIIRQAQLDVFQDQCDRDSLPEVKAYLETNHAEAANRLTSEELDRLCLAAFETARAYSFTKTVSLIWFAAMSLEMGVQFHRQKTINKELRNSESSEEERFQRLFEATTEEDWSEARSITNPVKN